MNNLHIEQVAVSELRPNPRNARVHSAKQLHQIKASIEAFGFNNPLLIDKDNLVIAGHGRLEAARLVGLQTVPVLRIEHLTPEQMRMFALADNKIALNAGWDMDMLRQDLVELSELDLDLEITGFATAEIDLLIDGPTSNLKADRADLVPAPPEVVISRPGDLWLLGDHRLLCGDASDAAAYADLMEGEQARVVFTDPPYNVPIDGNVSGHGALQHPRLQDGLGRDEFGGIHNAF